MANIAEDIRNGDGKAFEMFYRLEFNNLVHFITSYICDREKARDLAQDVLCTVWEKHYAIRPDSNLRAEKHTMKSGKLRNGRIRCFILNYKEKMHRRNSPISPRQPLPDAKKSTRGSSFA